MISSLHQSSTCCYCVSFFFVLLFVMRSIYSPFSVFDSICCSFWCFYDSLVFLRSCLRFSFFSLAFFFLVSHFSIFWFLIWCFSIFVIFLFLVSCFYVLIFSSFTFLYCCHISYFLVSHFCISISSGLCCCIFWFLYSLNSVFSDFTVLCFCNF